MTLMKEKAVEMIRRMPEDNMKKRLPDNFDPEKELREARAEKYENIG